jgi:hypothetical protein
VSRHLRPAAAVLLVSLVLSGCSLLSPDDPETSAGQPTTAEPTPTETGPAPIDRAFFGVHDHDPVGEAAGGWPDGPVGSMRAWDAAVTWRDIEPAPGQYEFGRLDALVDTAEQNDADVLLVLGQTPAFHAVDPTQTATWTSFESLTNITDNFARRVSGLFIPPTTGSYVFFIASDDQCNFYVNTNGNQPQGKVLVCQQTIWNGARLWNSGNDIQQRRSDQWSPDGINVPFFLGIPLVAGTQYYIEALYREGNGGDNLAVTYKLTTDDPLLPLDGDAPLLAGNTIGHMAAPAPSVGPTLSITRVGNNVQVSWTPTGGQLLTRTSLTSGTWLPAGTANPTILPISGEMYFRVVLP